MLSYFMADDTMSVFEPPVRNSGIVGGAAAWLPCLNCAMHSPRTVSKLTKRIQLPEVGRKGAALRACLRNAVSASPNAHATFPVEFNTAW